MNTAQLKTYAPQARRNFIAAITVRANQLGLSDNAGELEVAPVETGDDTIIIAGQSWPAKVKSQREKLIERIRQTSFVQTMEAVAYTWFNRFAALRFMEIHDYLGHGYRVLSNRSGSLPEILVHAADLAKSGALPGLNADKVIEFKLAGNKDSELYKMLLVAQCNALHRAMPFLFEHINDETELLLPANLLHTDSLIRQLVEQVDETLWNNIEIIGWLYQFYISEKKDQVIGKVVKSEDIPAATQLFTPNWIVKYMVQNSLGAQWLATYPNSPLKGQMEYYIEPAEQTDEVKAQLAAITPSQLDPEKLTLIDPACGSGHILVEAYELFKAIYLERGYRQKDVAQLILEKNLFGLDIDQRAAQLTGFALMMKGRADDRRLFERGVKLNVMALQDSTEFDAEVLAQGVELEDYGLKPEDLTELKRLFEYATTFGSLIQVPQGLAEKLPALKQLSEVTSDELFVSEALERLEPLAQQADLLAVQYDAVVANPPYLNNKAMTSQMKGFLKFNFPDGEKDTFAAFMLRVSTWMYSEASLVGLVTPFAWLYLSSFEILRSRLLDRCDIKSLVELETNAFEPAMVTVCSFILSGSNVENHTGSYVRLSSFKGAKNQAPRTLEAIRNRSCGWLYEAVQEEFKNIPGTPIGYWLGKRARGNYLNAQLLEEIAIPKQGATTSDNNRFLRLWPEVSIGGIGFQESNREHAASSGRKWFPYNKGGQFRRWYGNQDFVVNFGNDGKEIREFHEVLNKTSPGGRLKNQDCYFKPQLSWSKISSGSFSVRYFPAGFIFDVAGSAIFPDEKETLATIAGLLNSEVATFYLGLSPTLNFEAEHLRKLPYFKVESSCLDQLVMLAESDWNAYERSWDFQSLPLLTSSTESTPTLESSYTIWITQNRDTIAEMKRLEEENNRLFIDAYGLADELTPDVPIEQITLTVNPAYRYGNKLTEEAQWTRFRQDTCAELVSYAIGCMMGRYSLDTPGLIYAHSDNEGFDPSRYTTFPTDADGIIPLTDTEWFDDDATNRLIKFISVTWDKTHLEDNLTFLANNLSPKHNESSRDTIRRYLCDKFFKDHLKTYKKRPIYWLFTSGKQKAFQCLVYLHRYNKGTLARMRTAYLIPLTGKIQSRIEMLTQNAQAASTTSARNKLNKEIEALRKQHIELLGFDEKLRHYADKRIPLDLDYGVKVNYGQFGNLLSEVKAVTGKSPND